MDNISKYIRSSVNIDRSSENLNRISFDRTPIFKEELLFLRVLVEGKASLYLYKQGNLVRYFYNLSDDNINRLIHKYYQTENNKIGENNEFKSQLWNDLKCPVFKMNEMECLD